MSRIAGIVPSRAGSVQAMLEAITAHVPLTRVARELGPAALGVTTWREPNCAQDGAVLAVVDSTLWTANDVIALYRKRGFVDALKDIDGDFAIALFDTDTNTLWLARDRFGLKPLYYS